MKKFLGLVFLVLISFGMIACDGEDGETGASGILGPTGDVGPSGIDGAGLDHVPDGYHVDIFEDGSTHVCVDGYHYEYALDDGHVLDTSVDASDTNHDGNINHNPACRDADGELQPVIQP